MRSVFIQSLSNKVLKKRHGRKIMFMSTDAYSVNLRRSVRRPVTIMIINS
jgi:hypothetical protein